MTRLLAILLVLSASILSGCATAYAPVGLNHCAGFGMCRGGYSETQLDENTFRVSFQGNGKTPRVTTQRYLVYRCAELTRNLGYDYFVFINENTEAVGDKYRANAVIKVFRGDKPLDNSSAYKARDVLKNLGPQIRS